MKSKLIDVMLFHEEPQGVVSHNPLPNDLAPAYPEILCKSSEVGAPR